jgi:hypothetical protein
MRDTTRLSGSFICGYDLLLRQTLLLAELIVKM